MKKRSGLYIIVVAAIMLEVLSAFQYYATRNMLEKQLQERAQTELALKGIITKLVTDNTEKSLKSHIREIRSNLNTPDSLSDVLTWIIKYHSSRSGAGIAFKPNYYPQKDTLFEPYVLHTESDEFKVMQIAGKDFDYTRNGFYKEIMQKKRASWVGPYDVKYLHQRLISYAEPITEEKTSDTIAVLGIDIDTRYVAMSINKDHLYPSSFTVMLTEDGKLIAGPEDPALKKKVEHVIDIINDSAITKVLSDNGRTTIAEYRDPTNGKKGHVFFANMKGYPHWQLANVYYDDEVYGALRQLRINMLLMMVAAFAVLGFIIWRFFRNNQKLQKSLLKEMRINGELEMARDIQAKMLPTKWPPYPDRKDVDIYGLLKPAREVGGDLFDFFIRDENLFFCIGDVSGKGVPAAMVMTVTRSLFRSTTDHEDNPSNVMRNLNKTLCQGNDTNMFVTLFIGVLNLPTGRLRYCNAGHDKPLIVEQGSIRQLTADENLPLGVFNDIKYETEECILPSGCTLFLYTDGLTEAMSCDRQQFRLHHVKERLAHICEQQIADATMTVKDMEQAVNDFVGDAEQSDDLTLLAIRYTPPENTLVLDEQVTLHNDVKEVSRLSTFIKDVMTRLGIGKPLAPKLRLALEEAVVNVMEYAYPRGEKGNIDIRATYDGEHLRLIISDNGIAFNPTKTASVDTTLTAEERPVGGLGILLMRELMDSVNYERIDGRNILTLTKRIERQT